MGNLFRFELSTAGFFEERRDPYNLYPLLVDVHLFGGGYVDSVTRTLDRFGVKTLVASFLEPA